MGFLPELAQRHQRAQAPTAGSLHALQNLAVGAARPRITL